MSKDNYGTINTVEGEFEIKEFISSSFIGGRTVTVGEVNDGSFVVSIENVASSGLNPMQGMRLTKKSMVALISTMMLYFENSEHDLTELMIEMNGQDINYTASEGLSE